MLCFHADFYIKILCASKIECLRQMLSMWDLATASTDCKVRVLNSMAAAILSSKAGMAWGRQGAGVNEHNDSDLFVHFPGMGSLAMVMGQKEVR